jgi:PIN domain nuclease of toxin-antitoxin system
MSATRKAGARSVPRPGYELVQAILLDPDTTVTVEPFDVGAWPHFEAASMVLADPFDAAIVAAARTLGAPLVTRDRAIHTSGLVQTIW